MDRSSPDRDRMIIGNLHTIASRTWEAPTGQARDEVLTRLGEIAGGRTDLLAEAAGVLLGTRPADEDDPRHRQYTAGAEMLLEVADMRLDDPAVQHWVTIGAQRRDRRRGAFKTGGIA